VPLLARLVEEAGIPTVVVTMMPDTAEKYELPRILGVPFPFGHAFGAPNDVAMQREVSQAAIDLLADQSAVKVRRDLDHLVWPQDDRTAYKDWQPSEPSPIVGYNANRRDRLEEKKQVQ
jgi:hypothetical protein